MTNANINLYQEMNNQIADLLLGCEDNVMCLYAGTYIKHLEEQLESYKNLEEQGKLPKLPCAVGDTVYYADNEYYFAVLPVKVDEIAIMESNAILYKCLLFDGNGDVETQFDFDKDDFGKTVFLTPEEAETALEELETRRLKDYDSFRKAR